MTADKLPRSVLKDTDENLQVRHNIFFWLLLYEIVLNPLLHLLVTIVAVIVEMFGASLSHLGSQSFKWSKKGRHETPVSEPHYGYYYIMNAITKVKLEPQKQHFE